MWRVFSMIGVGVLMLLVAVVYARVAARFKGGSGQGNRKIAIGEPCARAQDDIPS